MQQVPNWKKTEACAQPLTKQRRLSWLGLVVSNWANLNDSSSSWLSGKIQKGSGIAWICIQVSFSSYTEWGVVQSVINWVKVVFFTAHDILWCRQPAEHSAERNTDQFAVSNSWGRGLCDGGVSTSLCFCFTLVCIALILKCALISGAFWYTLASKNFPFLIILQARVEQINE